MAENPYRSGQAETSRPPRTHATRWMVWVGVAIIALGVASVYVVIRTAYLRVAGSSIQPTPADLANSISLVMLAHLAVLPLFILGGLMVVAGFLVRKPLEAQEERQNSQEE